jgi:hypothetical protein
LKVKQLKFEKVKIIIFLKVKQIIFLKAKQIIFYLPRGERPEAANIASELVFLLGAGGYHFVTRNHLRTNHDGGSARRG